MAEALGTFGSIFTVVQLSLNTIKLLKDILNAPEEIQRLLDELQCITGIIGVIERLLD